VTRRRVHEKIGEKIKRKVNNTKCEVTLYKKQQQQQKQQKQQKQHHQQQHRQHRQQQQRQVVVVDGGASVSGGKLAPANRPPQPLALTLMKHN
jgi:pyrimidine operon attenuation protein/uracil phosphoribosyltransferase